MMIEIERIGYASMSSICPIWHDSLWRQIRALYFAFAFIPSECEPAAVSWHDHIQPHTSNEMKNNPHGYTLLSCQTTQNTKPVLMMVYTVFTVIKRLYLYQKKWFLEGFSRLNVDSHKRMCKYTWTRSTPRKIPLKLIKYMSMVILSGREI